MQVVQLLAQAFNCAKSWEAAVYDKQTDGRGCVPVTLYLQNLAGWVNLAYGPEHANLAINHSFSPLSLILLLELPISGWLVDHQHTLCSFAWQ